MIKIAESKKGVHLIDLNNYLFFNSPDIYYSLSFEIVESNKIKVILIKILEAETYIFENIVPFSDFGTEDSSPLESLKKVSILVYNHNFIIKEEVTGEGTVTIRVSKINEEDMTSEVVYEASGESPLTYEIPYAQTETYYSVYATATADKEGYNVTSGDATNPFIVVRAIPVPSTDPSITFVETTENGQIVSVEVVVTNADSYEIYVNNERKRGYVVEASTEEDKVIRVVATYDQDGDEPAYLPTTIERTYTLYKIEEDELEKTEAPSIAANAHMGNIYDENGTLLEEHHGYYQVVVTETEANSDLEYRVKYENGEWSDWMPYDPTSKDINFAVEGHYEVEARAKVDGKDYSNVVSVSFVVTETTGLELLNGEKAVAGVRYFNLAGQEMQEANGMTIVVTTYTDGTTSAVKVMK